MEYRLLHCLPKFMNLKPISYFFGIICLGFLSRIYWSSLDHDLMANTWEKAISILMGNLNSGCSYLITACILRYISGFIFFFFPFFFMLDSNAKVWRNYQLILCESSLASSSLYLFVQIPNSAYFKIINFQLILILKTLCELWNQMRLASLIFV